MMSLSYSVIIDIPVGTLARSRFERSRGALRCGGGSVLLEIARDHDLSGWCISFEFVEFREFFSMLVSSRGISAGLPLASRGGGPTGPHFS